MDLFKGYDRNFNPRSHEGNDSCRTPSFPLHCHFNPRSHEGNDFHLIIHRHQLFKFQSTFPRGERLSIGQESFIRSQNFNPRSHEGNDFFPPQTTLDFFISIHVPTRGTTAKFNKNTSTYIFNLYHFANHN